MAEQQQDEQQAIEQPAPPQTSQPDVSVNDYSVPLAADNDLNGQDASPRAPDRDDRKILPVQASLQNGHTSYQLLQPSIHSPINANGKTPVQKPSVKYLRKDQHLIIPTPLGMSPVENVKGRARTHAQLSARYWRATHFTYAEIRKMILPSHNQLQVCQAVDSKAYQARNEIFNDWNLATWYDGFETDQPELKDLVMAAFSAACQFNCDIRDVGVLNRPDMQVNDSAWAVTQNVPPERLENKIQPFSIQCIAALNYEPVGRYSLAAYVRAFGIGIGILPSKTSEMQMEWRFSLAPPSYESVMAVNQFQAAYQRPLDTLCANILAMFGILHLAKDRTYKSNDINMDRICASYIKTLRTDVTQYVDIDNMLAHKEAIARTGPHPFGLAQTLWIARVMGRHGLLTAPLALRLNATPPPVQRLMLAHACSREWANFPAFYMVQRAV
ncbi:uncharacterized protein LOC110032662 [Phalaenopsis equestris]|uniref:uncharacterized protein LOC110032662 n=1 Tax=Phalaenopsis equestris TaxID=78828 RepID=UPI0009E56EED|nr:uncharacterized protein LOC110032662 [Phalaenopsis equestris]